MWIEATEWDTREWATRPGAKWPCSTLRGHAVAAEVDDATGDLIDLYVDGQQGEDDYCWIDGHELTAFLDDVRNGTFTLED